MRIGNIYQALTMSSVFIHYQHNLEPYIPDINPLLTPALTEYISTPQIMI
jgi:hypothetical protein